MLTLLDQAIPQDDSNTTQEVICPVVVEETPPVGHSMPKAAMPSDPNGSTSPGGSSPLAKAVIKQYRKEELKLDVQRLTQKLTTHLLSGDTFETLLAQLTEDGKLKDLMIALGILTEKLLLLEGQPTAIIGQQQQAKLDQLLPALAEEMKRRQIKQTTITVHDEPGPAAHA